MKNLKAALDWLNWIPTLAFFGALIGLAWALWLAPRPVAIGVILCGCIILAWRSNR